MLDPLHLPPVAADELLARFVLFSRHVKSSENRVRPDAFMPHPHVELSVTRHREATDDELWSEGKRVADIRSATLHGIADVTVAAFAAENLSVIANPIAENPNHANSGNWPIEKPDQKIKALQIAAKSTYRPRPKGE